MRWRQTSKTSTKSWLAVQSRHIGNIGFLLRNRLQLFANLFISDFGVDVICQRHPLAFLVWRVTERAGEGLWKDLVWSCSTWTTPTKPTIAVLVYVTVWFIFALCVVLDVHGFMPGAWSWIACCKLYVASSQGPEPHLSWRGPQNISTTSKPSQRNLTSSLPK